MTCKNYFARITLIAAAQVCKYPDKTKRRKQNLSSNELIGSQMARLQREIVQDDDSCHVLQIRAPRAHTASRHISNNPYAVGPSDQSGSKSISRVEHGQDVAETRNDIAGSMTISFTSRSNYVGPALLRSRAPGLKRAGSATSAGIGEDDSVKRSKVDYSLSSGSCRMCLLSFHPFRPLAQLK
jgi:hypothetical protein